MRSGSRRRRLGRLAKTVDLALWVIAVTSQIEAEPPKELSGHELAVYDAAFTPDGRWLVTASFDRTLRLWDLQTGQSSRTLEGHGGLVLCVAVSPDGTRIASGSYDNTIKIWDVPKADAAGQAEPPMPVKPAADLRGHGSYVAGVAFSPDGKQLASASNDKTVRLWDLERKQQIKTLSTQAGVVYAVVFSPDGKHLVTACADKTVRLIDVQTGAEVRQFSGPEFPVYTVAVSPDGQKIAAGGQGLGSNRKVFVWNVGGSEPVQVLEGHEDDVYQVAFSPKGDKLLTAGYSGAVKVWDLGTGQTVHTADLPIVLYSAAYSPDGQRIAVTSDDGKARLIDLPPEAQ
ncbi:MAG: WD40 repeat domain-containing protein [Planctomycetaceae bacterium]